MKNDARAIELLKDAMFMLEQIKNARDLPAYAQVHQQYIALGREIRVLLLDEGAVQ